MHETQVEVKSNVESGIVPLLIVQSLTKAYIAAVLSTTSYCIANAELKRDGTRTRIVTTKSINWRHRENGFELTISVIEAAASPLNRINLPSRRARYPIKIVAAGRKNRQEIKSSYFSGSLNRATSRKIDLE